MSSDKLTVTLSGGKPWGFRMVGGTDQRSLLQIQEITGQKARDAGLKPNYIIYAINSNYTGGMTHQEAKNMIINSGSTLTLVLLKSSQTVEYQELVSSVAKSITPNNDTTSSQQLSNKATQAASGLTSLPKSCRSSASEMPNKPSPPKEETISYGLNSSITKQELDEKEKHIKNRLKEVNLDKKPSVDEGCINDESGLYSKNNKTKSPFMRALEDHISAEVADGPILSKTGITKIEPPTYILDMPPSSNTNKSSLGKTVPLPSTENKIKEKAPILTAVKKYCNKCGMLIGEKKFLTTHNLYFHSEHFTCVSCNVNLVSSGHIFEESNKKIYCKSCHNQFILGSAAPGSSNLSASSSNCTKCNQQMQGSYLTAGRQKYHPDCFVCQNCIKSLSNQQFMLDSGHPYCVTCYEQLFSEKCSKCTRPITPGQPYLSVNDQTLHSTCFTCFICNEQLKSFKQLDGKPVCPSH